MQCPSCQHTDSRVLESRAADCGRSVRRRRECLNCDFRFTTYERVETVPITVVKRNTNRETFNRSKLLHGVLRACEKTGLELARLEVVVDEIELQLQQRSPPKVPRLSPPDVRPSPSTGSRSMRPSRRRQRRAGR